MKRKVADLSGRALDYAVALCEGYGWAKNMSGRSGDSHAQYRDRNHKPEWPIGSRCFVRPSSLKDLKTDEKNWDGWCISDMSEPVAPAALYDVPKYHRRWEDTGPIIEQEGISIRCEGPQLGWYAVTAQGHKAFRTCEGFDGGGNSPLEAAMRCYVASKFGEEIDIPKEVTKK